MKEIGSHTRFNLNPESGSGGRNILNQCISFFSLYLFLSAFMFSQEKMLLKGKVISQEDGIPVVGASVLVKNTTIGTSTDSHGYFRIVNAPSDRSTISISAVGFKTVTHTVTASTDEEIIIELFPSLIQTQTVVVTANKRQQSLEEIPVSMNIIEAKSFEIRNTVSLDDALRYVPGVNFQQGQINIRASSGYSRGVGSRVMMLVDGVPLLTGDTGEITFESIPVFQIERVEVVKGAGSALYGSGALGGVINVLTKEIRDGSQLWWRFYGGMYSEPKYDQWRWSERTRWLNGQSFGFSMRDNKLGLAGSLQRIEDDGYRDQDLLRRYSGFFKMTYDLSAFQSVTITSNLFQQYRSEFLWWKDLKNAFQPPDAQRNATVSSLRFNTGVHYKHFVNEKFFYNIQASHFRGNWHRDSLSNKRLDESISDAIVFEVQGNLSFDTHNVLTGGIVGNNERVISDIFGTHHGNGVALYLQDEYLFSDELSATVGVRQDMQHVIGLPSHQQTNPKIGLRYSVNEYHTLRASAGRGFRSPSIGELFTSTTNTGSAAIIIPSVTLKPEVSTTYEISSTHVLSRNLQLEVALFHSDFNDLIEPNVQSDTVLKAVTVNFKNITQAQIQGFELSALTKHLEQALTVDLHYNYNWAIDAKTKMFLRFRPRHIASVNSSYHIAPLTAALDYRFVSRIEAIDDQLVDLAPIKNGSQRVAIHVLDVRLLSDWTEYGVPFRTSLNINNVLGYNYVELIGNISPPRSFVLSFEGIIE